MKLIGDDWNETQGNTGLIYWRESPKDPEVRFHVSQQKARTFGSIPGQILSEDGWYWYTGDIHGRRFSSMYGPFTSAVSAMADCEVANR